MTVETDTPSASTRHSSNAASTVPARPLRIGMMLRAIDEIDGAGVYIRNLCRALFELDTFNYYACYYDDDRQLGRFNQFRNVRERVLTARHKLLWDQVSVPLAARHEALDLLFHHKFSIPLFAPCPTIVQQRGTEYWTMPETRDRLDNWYNRTMIPLYCERAQLVLTNSNTLAEELNHYVGVPLKKMRTVYAAPDERFLPVTDPERTAAVRRRYGLPDRGFFLMVVKGYHRVGFEGKQLYNRKNIQGTVLAHRRLWDRVPDCPPLVIAGPGVAERFREGTIHEVPGPAAVCLPGFIDYEDMPVLYSMATALLFPSYSESFGIPLVEAMACDCPIITSDRGACPEVVGDAGLIVDPDDVDGLDRAMERIVLESGLAKELRLRGRARASEFTWAASARKLLEIFREVSAARPQNE